MGGLSSNKLVLDQRNKLIGYAKLDEQVTAAQFDLKLSGELGTLIHCSGNAAQSKNCTSGLGYGSVSFNAMHFPMAPGNSSVDVDVDAHWGAYVKKRGYERLAETQLVVKATDQKGADLFCMRMTTAPHSDCLPDGHACSDHGIHTCD